MQGPTGFQFTGSNRRVCSKLVHSFQISGDFSDKLNTLKCVAHQYVSRARDY